MPAISKIRGGNEALEMPSHILENSITANTPKQDAKIEKGMEPQNRHPTIIPI